MPKKYRVAVIERWERNIEVEATASKKLDARLLMLRRTRTARWSFTAPARPTTGRCWIWKLRNTSDE